MKINLPYGDRIIEGEIPNLDDLFVLSPLKDASSISDLEQEVNTALEYPIQSKRISELISPKDDIVLIVSDVTRKSPSKIFVECISCEIQKAGVPFENVSIVVATGTHRACTQHELEEMLGGSNLARFKVANHSFNDKENLIYIGDTQRGIPIWINRNIAESNFRIATGAITPHHGFGFSGGRKAILPGVSGVDTINKHHSFPIHPFKPALGQIEGNPAHEEALDAARKLGVDFIINAVPNPQAKGYIAVVAGNLEKAHSAGVAICRDACQASFPFLADLTICSPGGYPRDMNLYQAQKALSVAEMVTRSGGIIILVAECRDGIGGEFVKWFQSARVPQEVIERFHETGWTSSSGKAMMFARASMEHKIILVCEAFEQEFLKSMFIAKAVTLKEAIQESYKTLGLNPKTIIIPYASGIIPVMSNHVEAI